MLLRITPSEAPNAKTQGQQSEPAPNRITRARKAASAQLICQMVDYSDDISYRSRCHVFSRTSVNRSCTSYRIAATAQDTAKRPLSNMLHRICQGGGAGTWRHIPCEATHPCPSYGLQRPRLQASWYVAALQTSLEPTLAGDTIRVIVLHPNA